MPRTEAMHAGQVEFKGHNGDTISGYLAAPAGGGPAGAVIVLHEIFGLVPHIKEVARKMAAHGYLALAPDLFHREGPGEPDDVAAAVRAAGGPPDARVIGDVAGAAKHLRSLPGSNGKVGVMGFCSGGRQTYLVACNIPDLNAAIDCYGGRVVANNPTDVNPRQPVAPIEMTANLACPLMGLFGAEDKSPSLDNVKRMEQELKKHGKTYEFHVYENAGHAFFADYRPSYRQAAAVDGWQKVFGWWERWLG
ncbi:MAG: dienelactone hydrolase family protein [SAR202 cluster bacterium]|nr:dienelactone hydrolase family protein [SAR202 cluster bacterium]